MQAASYRVLGPAIAPLAEPMHLLGGATMGTTWRIKLARPPGVALPMLRQAVEAELARVVTQMSTWEPDSDLCLYNRAPAGSWQPLPAEFRQVLRAALELARDSGGAYDPTIGPVVDLWGFGPAPRRDGLPELPALAAARQRVGWQRIELDDAEGRVLQPGGAALDLSSIAKGFAVDAVAQALRRLGVADALVEVGGELLGLGDRAWRVAVSLGGEPGPVLALRGLAVATSGDHFQHFESDGQRYSHTLDPRSGRPVGPALASVSVVHRQCMQADGLATALCVLGPDEGWQHALRHRVAALFARRAAGGLDLRATPAFERLLVQHHPLAGEGARRRGLPPLPLAGEGQG